MNTEKLSNENKTEALNKHVVMQALPELSNEVLAEAFAILYDKEWKNYWPVKSKADEMRSIIRANDQPCRPFENWVRCIDFLMAQGIAAVGQRSAGTNAEAVAVTHGICKERSCNEPATKDYNGHEHWVCDYHYDKLNDEFDEEYR